MKTLNLELVFDDLEELNLKITVRKGGEVDIKTLPPTPAVLDEKNNTGDGIVKETTKKSTAKKKKPSGNFMDVDF